MKLIIREIVENLLSGMKAGFKTTRNLVFNQKAERSTMNRQKSRGIVENVLSGIKAGFNNLVFNQKAERTKMNRKKSSSKLSATLLALILGASVFMAGQVWAAKYVTDPTNGKVYSAPEWGGTITFAKQNDGASTNVDLAVNGGAMHMIALVTEKLATLNWGLERDLYAFSGGYMTQVFALMGTLAESWERHRKELTYSGF